MIYYYRQARKTFCGLTLDWNYLQGVVDIAMPQYVQKALQKLNHTPPIKPQNLPHAWVQITYGRQIHKAITEDNSPMLSQQETTNIQQIVGSFLYYARAVDNTIYPAINQIANTQARPTQHTRIEANILLDYLYTHPSAKLRFTKSDMQLHIDSDAAYLVAPKAKSRAAGYFYLSDKSIQPPLSSPPTLNAPIHIEYILLKHV